jgi:hypothetical protein
MCARQTFDHQRKSLMATKEDVDIKRLAAYPTFRLPPSRQAPARSKRFKAGALALHHTKLPNYCLSHRPAGAFGWAVNK